MRIYGALNLDIVMFNFNLRLIGFSLWLAAFS